MTSLIAMADVEFISAAYLVVLVGLAVYAVRLLRTGRRLSQDLPADRRRWSQ